MAGTGEEDESRNKQCSLIGRTHDRMPWTEKAIGWKEIMSVDSLDDLGDFLLVEVLQRLSTAKSAISCKSVCKRWCSLISSDYFMRCFITHHARKNLAAAASVDDAGHSFNSLLGTCQNPGGFIRSRSTILYENSINSFNLKFIPERKDSILVLASSCNDLVLCGVHRGAEVIRFYVCNPFTRRYVAIPSMPKKELPSIYEEGPYDYGLVSEPFYPHDSHGCGESLAVRHEYRFRVVQVGLDTLDIYSSEKNEWTELVLSGEEYLRASNIVPYNGRLHWFNGEHVFAYDPFNAEKSCFIDGSQFRFRDHVDHNYGQHCLGVCQGRLRMMQLPFRHKHILAVWELKNYAKRDWSLEHKVNLKTMVSRNHALDKAINEFGMVVLGFHISDRDRVYLEMNNSLVYSCNLRTRELKFLQSYFYNYSDFFPVMLPLWPTPLPTLQ